MNGAPIIGDPDQRAKMAIGQSIRQMSMEIYTQTASKYLASHPGGSLVPGEGGRIHENLCELAKLSQQAAKAYFEGLGLATFSDTPSVAPK